MNKIIFIIGLFSLTACDNCDYKIHYNAGYDRYFVWSCNSEVDNNYSTEKEAVDRIKYLRQHPTELKKDRYIYVPKEK